MTFYECKKDYDSSLKVTCTYYAFPTKSSRYKLIFFKEGYWKAYQYLFYGGHYRLSSSVDSRHMQEGNSLPLNINKVSFIKESCFNFDIEKDEVDVNFFEKGILFQKINLKCVRHLIDIRRVNRKSKS